MVLTQSQVPPSMRNDDPVSLDNETSSQPFVAATEIVPIADYEVPSNAPSEAAPSSCGETFSTFTAGTLRSRWTTAPARSLLTFTTLSVYNDAIRTLPFEIDGHPEASCSRAPPPCPLPWLYEFLWRDGAILFAGDPLNTAQTRSRPNGLGAATFWDSMERSATATTYVMACKSADEVTCKSWGSATLRRAAFERGQIQKVIEEARAYLLEQLEAYWRSHPPQRSASRQKGKGPAHQAEQRPSTRAASRPYSKRGFAGGRRRIGQGSGDGDEDDDGEGDSTPVPTSSTTNAQDRWYACPYQKWRPQHYLLGCGAGFRRITDVKTHLLKKHFAITCPRCRSVYDDEDLLRLHRLKGCGKPPRSHPDGCIMSERQRDTIKAHFGGKKMLHHEQWGFLFRTLFPNEPFPESIYLLPQQEERRNLLESWVLSAKDKALNAIRCQDLDISHRSWNEPIESQLAEVIAQFITLKLQEDVSDERLYADFAMAQQDFERSLSSAACVSTVANHQALTAPGLTLAHDAVAQLPTSEWNPQYEPNLLWPMPTVGEHTGIPGCLNTNVNVLGPTSACSNNSNLSKVSSGFAGNSGISLNDWYTLTSRNGPRCTSNVDGPAIPGIDLPGPSSLAQWAGDYQQDEFTHLNSSHLTNGAAPEPSSSAIVGVDDYARPLTAWNSLVQDNNWYLPDNPFNQSFGPSRILDDGMISGWPRTGALQPILEMSEL